MFWYKFFGLLFNYTRLRNDQGVCYLLQDVSVELFLSIAEEFSNHLPAQPLSLEQEVGHTNRRVRDEPPLSQILDALFWFPDAGKY